MLLNLASLLYLLAFAAGGFLLSAAVFRRETALHRIFFGLVFGLFLLIWLPALFSFLIGFTLLSQILALAALLVIAGLSIRFGALKASGSVPHRELLPLLATVLPLWLFSLILLSSHTILPRGETLWVGQSTYGDLAMHLGFITSISEQQTFPPMYSICPDTVVGYPFLCDSVSSTFYTLGASLRFSTMLPSAYALLVVFFGAYMFFSGWLKKRGVSAFAVLLFFIGGGLGFAYFFDLWQKEPGNFSRIFTGFYETPTNLPDLGLRWVNPIADMLIPQRATLFGWALLFPSLYLLYHAAFEEKRSYFLPLAVLAGGLPLVHTHSFMALGVISAVYLLRSLLKNEGKAQWLGYLSYAGIALLLAAPQLFAFTFKQAGSFLTFNWNWDNTSDSFLWFYVKNWGLLFLLLPSALLCAKRKDLAVMSGPLFLWALAELIQFQPNPYDNNKLIFVFYFFLCGLIAQFLFGMRTRAMADTDSAGKRWSVRVISALACFVLFASGTLTLAREYVSEYQLIGEAEYRSAMFVKQNTEKDATFLTYNNHNNAIAALTGRNIVCGSGSFLYFHGVNYAEREQALRFMFEEPTLYFDSLAQKYDVDYVVIGPYERANYTVDSWYFDENLDIVYDADGITIYRAS